MEIGANPVRFQVDCGATVNILPKKYVGSNKIEKTSKVLQMWNRDKLKPEGTCRLIVKNRKTKKKYSVEFIVVKESLTPLIGASAAQQMKLITVNTDHFKQVNILTESQMEEDKNDIFKRMLLRTHNYDIQVRYKKGTKMFTSDMLSRAYLPLELNGQTEFERVNMVKFLPIREERLNQIREATQQDETMQLLKDVILHGWPESKVKVHTLLTPYFSSKDELSLQNARHGAKYALSARGRTTLQRNAQRKGPLANLSMP